MADPKETSRSSSRTAPEPSGVIQAPTRRPRGKAEELPVDTTQNYDAGNEPEGLGKEGFVEVGDETTLSPRHQARVDSER